MAAVAAVATTATATTTVTTATTVTKSPTALPATDVAPALPPESASVGALEPSESSKRKSRKRDADDARPHHHKHAADAPPSRSATADAQRSTSPHDAGAPPPIATNKHIGERRAVRIASRCTHCAALGVTHAPRTDRPRRDAPLLTSFALGALSQHDDTTTATTTTTAFPPLVRIIHPPYILSEHYHY